MDYKLLNNIMFCYNLIPAVAKQPNLGLEVLALRFLDRTQLDRPGKSHLNGWSAHHRGRHLHTTQQTQETNIHAPSGILTRDPSNWSAIDQRLRRHGHQDRLFVTMAECILDEKVIVVLSL